MPVISDNWQSRILPTAFDYPDNFGRIFDRLNTAAISVSRIFCGTLLAHKYSAANAASGTG